jgi:hypothetical protein
MPWPGISIDRCRDSGQSFKYYSAQSSIKLAGLFKHGAFVAGNHDLTLTLNPVTVVLDPPLFYFETGRSDAIRRLQVWLSPGRWSAHFFQIHSSLRIYPSGHLLLIFVPARGRLIFGGSNRVEKEKGVSLEPFRSRLLTPFQSPGADSK